MIDQLQVCIGMCYQCICHAFVLQNNNKKEYNTNKLNKVHSSSSVRPCKRNNHVGFLMECIKIRFLQSLQQWTSKQTRLFDCFFWFSPSFSHAQSLSLSFAICHHARRLNCQTVFAVAMLHGSLSIWIASRFNSTFAKQLDEITKVDRVMRLHVGAYEWS